MNLFVSLSVKMVVSREKNLTCATFCKCVNESLLDNNVLEPGYPRRISWATARRWLHNLGFRVIKKQKGIFKKDDCSWFPQ